MENLENILESILFYSGDPVDKALLKEKLGIKEGELNKALAKIEEKYDEKSGIRLIRFKDKLQFATNSNYSDFVDLVLKKTREKALSKNILETVAIIAYKQPVTRLDIETIRGGAPADYAIRALLEHKLIEVVGRKEALGRPLLFGTTDEFLKRFNLENLDELPDYGELMSQIKELNQIVDSTQNLYNEYELPDTEIKSQESVSERRKETAEEIENIKNSALEEVRKSNEENALQTTDNNENTKENDFVDSDAADEEDYQSEESEDSDAVTGNEDEFDDSPDFLDDSDFIISSEIKEFKR